MKNVKMHYLYLFVIASSILLVVLFLWQFVAVGIAHSNDAGSCFSIALDKKDMLSADKIILCIDGKVIPVTEPTLMKELCRELVVADRTDLCGAERNWWIDVYKGDRLIRPMRWEDCCELVEVYSTDSTHWLWPSYSRIGQVELSDEILDKLHAIIEAN